MREHEPEVVRLRGPVERMGGKLLLRIPLDAGGARLAPRAAGISQIEDGWLQIEIQPWLADQLGIVEGCDVVVDDAGGTFNIRRAPDHA